MPVDIAAKLLDSIDARQILRFEVQKPMSTYLRLEKHVRKAFRMSAFLLIFPALCQCCACNIFSSRGTVLSPYFALDGKSYNSRATQGVATGVSAAGLPINVFFDTTSIYMNTGPDLSNSVTAITTVLPRGTDHIGDGDYDHGLIYAVIEHWMGCDASNAPVYIEILNPGTMQTVKVSQISNRVPEASSLAVDPDTGEAYVASFCDSKSLYVFRLSDLSFIRAVKLPLEVQYIQGVAYRQGSLYIASANGALFGLNLADQQMEILMQMTPPGEYEGIDFHGNYLRWLVNGADHSHSIYTFSVKQPLP